MQKTGKSFFTIEQIPTILYELENLTSTTQ